MPLWSKIPLAKVSRQATLVQYGTTDLTFAGFCAYQLLNTPSSIDAKITIVRSLITPALQTSCNPNDNDVINATKLIKNSLPIISGFQIKRNYQFDARILLHSYGMYLVRAGLYEDLSVILLALASQKTAPMSVARLNRLKATMLKCTFSHQDIDKITKEMMPLTTSQHNCVFEALFVLRDGLESTISSLTWLIPQCAITQVAHLQMICSYLSSGSFSGIAALAQIAGRSEWRALHTALAYYTDKANFYDHHLQPVVVKSAMPHLYSAAVALRPQNSFKGYAGGGNPNVDLTGFIASVKNVRSTFTSANSGVASMMTDLFPGYRITFNNQTGQHEYEQCASGGPAGPIPLTLSNICKAEKDFLANLEPGLEDLVDDFQEFSLTQPTIDDDLGGGTTVAQKFSGNMTFNVEDTIVPRAYVPLAEINNIGIPTNLTIVPTGPFPIMPEVDFNPFLANLPPDVPLAPPAPVPPVSGAGFVPPAPVPPVSGASFVPPAPVPPVSGASQSVAGILAQFGQGGPPKV